jgi:hypothetical protein
MAHEYDFQGKHWKTITPEGSMSTKHSHGITINLKIQEYEAFCSPCDRL